MIVKLRVILGPATGKEITITQDLYRIGRGDDCQLRCSCELLSHQHCSLFIEASQVVLRDLGSRNGTYVNGERIHDERPLKPGDLVMVGTLVFEVLISSDIVERTRVFLEDDSDFKEIPDTVIIRDNVSAESPKRRTVTIGGETWEKELTSILDFLKANHVHYAGSERDYRRELLSSKSETRTKLAESFQPVLVFDCQMGIATKDVFDLSYFLEYEVRDRLATALGFDYGGEYHQEQIAQLIEDLGNRPCLFCFLDVDVLGHNDLLRLREFTQSRHRVLFCGPNAHIVARAY